MGVVLLTLHLPGVFWLARSAFRFGPVGSLGSHVVVWRQSRALFYAMYQVSLGQLLAAPGRGAADVGRPTGVSRAGHAPRSYAGYTAG